MITRYSIPQIQEIWSDKRKYEIWFDIEANHISHLNKTDILSKKQLEQIKSNIVLDEIYKIEKEVKHDVIAFLNHIEEIANKLGLNSRYIHYGLTSSDIKDTCLSIQIKESIDFILLQLKALHKVLKNKVSEYRNVPMIGRTHGMHAQIITCGLMLSGHLEEIIRAIIRIKQSSNKVKVGKNSGAVGNFLHLTPEQESNIIVKLKLVPENISTQIIPRDRHAEIVFSLIMLMTAFERLAINIRNLHRPEISEMFESFSYGQKGSSAMPHKKNPIDCENICGLSRLVRSYMSPAIENIVLWHERDMTHSSVERIIFPDLMNIVSYSINKMINIISNLTINIKNMNNNIKITKNKICSEQLMLSLVDKGMSRKTAYNKVQKLTSLSEELDSDLIDVAITDSELLILFSKKEIKNLFFNKLNIKNINKIIDKTLSFDF